jgi:uncharacterized protein DUF481
MNKATILSLLLLFLISTPLFAREKTDVVVMKNGDRLTCQIKGMNSGTLYLSLDYVDGTISVQWSKVDRLESKQLFIVGTADGSMYTGTLRVATESGSQPVTIQMANSDEVTIEKPQIVRMGETSEKFWRRFNGTVDFGLVHSKGDQSTQYNFSSQTEYLRERWSASVDYSSALSSSTGSSASTRNLVYLNGVHLLPWNNYFYTGIGGYLQSTELGISRQTILGTGIGRYLKKTNRANIAVVGGLGWQSTKYTENVAPIANREIAVGLIGLDVSLFKFSKTNLTVKSLLVPAISDAGGIRFTTNATYYLKLFSNLSWNLSFYGNWEDHPPTHLSGSDWGSSSGLTWTFGFK